MVKNLLKILILSFLINKGYADEIEEIREKINELKKEIQKLESLINKNDLKETPRINQWVEPVMGWEFDYENNIVYVVDNNGTHHSANVGIGTNNPLGRLHIVGDFYNQGFEGSKSNYTPEVNWNDINSLTINTHGSGEDSSVVLIFAHVQFPGAAGVTYFYIRVIREDGIVVGTAIGGGSNNTPFGATLVTFDHPLCGSHTYTLQSSISSYSGYQFFIVEIKR